MRTKRRTCPLVTLHTSHLFLYPLARQERGWSTWLLWGWQACSSSTKAPSLCVWGGTLLSGSICIQPWKILENWIGQKKARERMTIWKQRGQPWSLWFLFPWSSPCGLWEGHYETRCYFSLEPLFTGDFGTLGVKRFFVLFQKHVSSDKVSSSQLFIWTRTFTIEGKAANFPMWRSAGQRMQAGHATLV